MRKLGTLLLVITCFLFNSIPVLASENVPEYNYDGILDLPVVEPDPEDPEAAFKPVLDEYSWAISLGKETPQPQEDFKYVGLEYNGYAPDEGTVYAFYDINKDGVSEMLVGTGSTSGSWSVTEVFYMDGGEIGKLFDSTFNYRVVLHIGSDGTVMTEGSSGASGRSMIVYSANDLASPDQIEEYYFDRTDHSGMNGVKISEADYNKKVNDYIMNGPDYSSLDWHFFVTPDEGEYAPDPGKEPPVPATTDTISGLYVDTGDWDSPCQINFDSKSHTFTLIMTNWNDYEVYDGTYSIDENGVIECDASIGVYTFEKKIRGADELFPSHYTISGNGDAIIPVEDGLGLGDSYVRVSDGYTISPDSGSGTVTGDAVRIRCGPGTDYFFFTELNAGTKVSIIGSCGEWYRVQCYDSYGSIYRGFIHSDYVSRD